MAGKLAVTIFSRRRFRDPQGIGMGILCIHRLILEQTGYQPVLVNPL